MTDCGQPICGCERCQQDWCGDVGNVVYGGSVGRKPTGPIERIIEILIDHRWNGFDRNCECANFDAFRERHLAESIIEGLGLKAQYSHDCGVTRYKERPPWWSDMKSREVRYVTPWVADL